ncbi:hypothetical protein M3Y99_01658100 [Aphelenchoides fujianensis]|nr:hypothetical protein M3Y99_01658100 [Aphelenchoides fujianensis]
MILFVGSNLQPTTPDAVFKTVPIAKIPASGHEVHEHPNSFAATRAAPASSKQEEDGVLAALKELSSKFDAERAERSKQMAEQQLKFDAQQSAMLEISKQLNDRQSKFERMQAAYDENVANFTATIVELKQQIADLHRVNVSIAPTPLYTCEPKPEPKPQPSIWVKLGISLLAVVFMCVVFAVIGLSIWLIFRLVKLVCKCVSSLRR